MINMYSFRCLVRCQIFVTRIVRKHSESFSGAKKYKTRAMGCEAQMEASGSEILGREEPESSDSVTGIPDCCGVVDPGGRAGGSGGRTGESECGTAVGARRMETWAH